MAKLKMAVPTLVLPFSILLWFFAGWQFGCIRKLCIEHI